MTDESWKYKVSAPRGRAQLDAVDLAMPGGRRLRLLGTDSRPKVGRNIELGVIRVATILG
jgi:hypothetical protein